MRETDLSSPGKSKSGRIVWVDVAKGFLMSLVILFHTLPPQLVADLINPAACTFFFLSGLTSKDLPLRLTVRKRFKQLMVPYYVMSAVNVLIWLFAKVVIDHEELNFGLGEVLCNVLIVRTAVGVTPLNLIPLWFLPAVFVMEIYYGLFRKLKILPLGILAGFVSMFFFPGSMPFKIDVALAILPFFVFGKVLGSNLTFISKMRWPVLLSIAVLYLGAAYSTKEVYLMEDYFGSRPLFYILAGFLSVFLIVVASQRLERVDFFRNIFTKLGRNTLFVLGYHIAAGSLVYPFFDLFDDPITLLRKFWYIYWLIDMAIVYAAIRFLPKRLISLMSGVIPSRAKRGASA